MPIRDDYEHLTISSALAKFAEHHFAHKRRHISRDEYTMLLSISEILRDMASAKLVYSLPTNNKSLQARHEVALAKRRIGQLTKKETLSQISEILNIETNLSPGSTVPVDAYLKICKVLNLQVKPRFSKQDLARLIVESAGNDWMPNYVSSGSTVTGDGLAAVLSSVKSLRAKML
jgi:hypothetical protein